MENTLGLVVQTQDPTEAVCIALADALQDLCKNVVSQEKQSQIKEVGEWLLSYSAQQLGKMVTGEHDSQTYSSAERALEMTRAFFGDNGELQEAMKVLELHSPIAEGLLNLRKSYATDQAIFEADVSHGSISSKLKGQMIACETFGGVLKFRSSGTVFKTLQKTVRGEAHAKLAKLAECAQAHAQSTLQKLVEQISLVSGGRAKGKSWKECLKQDVSQWKPVRLAAKPLLDGEVAAELGSHFTALMKEQSLDNQRPSRRLKSRKQNRVERSPEMVASLICCKSQGTSQRRQVKTRNENGNKSQEKIKEDAKILPLQIEVLGSHLCLHILACQELKNTERIEQLYGVKVEGIPIARKAAAQGAATISEAMLMSCLEDDALGKAAKRRKISGQFQKVDAWSSQLAGEPVKELLHKLVVKEAATFVTE